MDDRTINKGVIDVEFATYPLGRYQKKQRSLNKKRVGMVVDLRRCIGCHACSVACKTENEVPLGGFRNRVRYLEQAEVNTLSFLPLLCMHCQDAPCLDACPTQAPTRLADGRVVSRDHLGVLLYFVSLVYRSDDKEIQKMGTLLIQLSLLPWVLRFNEKLLASTTNPLYLASGKLMLELLDFERQEKELP